MTELHEPPEPRRDPAADTVSPFIPMLILGLVLAGWFGFQATQLRVERAAMADILTNQDKQIQDSRKLRDSLDAISRGTARLADSGNPNAKLIVDELRKRGVNITANPTPSNPAPPAKN